MGWIRLISFALCLVFSARVSAADVPNGNCSVLPFLEKLERWCESVRSLPGPKHWYCPSNLSLIEIATHNEHTKMRLEGRPHSPVMLSCGEYCGSDPYHARVYSFFAPNDEAQSDGLVSSVIYCQCPNTVYGSKLVPPTIPGYRADLRKGRDWEPLAELDRYCSGRGGLAVETHNRRLFGKRCGTKGQKLHLVCPAGEIDHCSRFASPAAIGAEPWEHRCETY